MIGNGAVIINKLPNSVATLHVGGVVTLSGGGTVSLLDVSGYGLAAIEVITGTVAGDTLDNIDNTISGYGQLGNGLMTLKNEAKGTINATGGTLTVDTGKNSILNKHLIEATSGVLDLRSNVTNAAATISRCGWDRGARRNDRERWHPEQFPRRHDPGDRHCNTGRHCHCRHCWRRARNWQSQAPTRWCSTAASSTKAR